MAIAQEVVILKVPSEVAFIRLLMLHVPVQHAVHCTILMCRL